MADSDRIASAIPGQVAAKNILFSKLWAQLKAIFGVNNWSAREYRSSPCIVVYDKQQYILDETIQSLPFTSVDFNVELSSGIWKSLGANITIATYTDMDDGTNDVKAVSPLKFVYGITTRVFSGLSTTVKTIQGAINELLALLNITQDVNVGFCSKCPVLPNDVLRDDTTRTLTIATVKGGTTISASNPIRFFTAINEQKSKWEKTTAQSVVWDNTKGLKYFYFDNDGVLKVSNSPWAIGSITFVWRLYWNPAETGAKRIVREAWECHTNTISASDHTWKHSQGAIWIRNSGLDIICTPLVSGAPSATGVNTCLSLTGGRCQDDNLQYTITNSTTPANFSQDLGNITAASITTTNGAVMDITYNAPDGTLTIIDGTRFAFHAIASVPQIITAGGVITPVSNGYFFNYYIYSFQDPRFGKVINLRSGLSYATKAEADAETWETIKAASPTLQDGEVKQLYKSTWEYRTSYDAAINKAALRGFVDLRSNASLSATIGGGSGASIASNVSVTPPPTFISGDMQSLSNEFGADIIKFSAKYNFAGQPKMIHAYDRAVILTSDIRAAGITDLRVGKNGAIPVTIAYPYSIAANDVIEFAATYDFESTSYFTVKGTYND